MHNDAAARNRKQAQDEPELTNLLARLYRAVNTPQALRPCPSVRPSPLLRDATQ